MKNIAYFILILTMINGIAIVQGDELTKEIYEKELVITQELILKAKAVDGLWRDTNKLVEQATLLADKNKFEDGIALLQQAQFQAQSGYDQASKQSNLTNLIPYYLKP